MQISTKAARRIRVPPFFRCFWLRLAAFAACSMWMANQPPFAPRSLVFEIIQQNWIKKVHRACWVLWIKPSGRSGLKDLLRNAPHSNQCPRPLPWSRCKQRQHISTNNLLMALKTGGVLQASRLSRHHILLDGARRFGQEERWGGKPTRKTACLRLDAACPTKIENAKIMPTLWQVQLYHSSDNSYVELLKPI